MMRQRAEKRAPVGSIVGIALCLVLFGGFLVLVKTGVIGGSKGSDAPLPPPPPPTTSPAGTGAGPTSPGTPGRPALPPAAGDEVRVVFEGRFSAEGDTRKVTFKCPFCQKDIVDVPAPNCLSCGKGVKWPQNVSCGFCSGSGRCGFCKGEGKCPQCAKGGRMLMGVKPPCDLCHHTDKCPACGGSGSCPFCEGGKYYPGRPKRTVQSKVEEPDQPIPKPQP